MLITILFLTVFNLAAQTEIYDRWDELSKVYIQSETKDGIQFQSIDYLKLQNDPKFAGIIQLLQEFDISLLAQVEEKLAFWVNVYNIAAVKVVLDNKIPVSIRDGGNLFKPVWKNDAIKIGGKIYSLGEIEHDILRSMNQPLIHFGIVCASLSCPDLIKQAYRPETVIQQLEENTKHFLQNKTKGMKVNRIQKTAEISTIFKWFKADFESVPKFIEKYSDVDISAYKIKYLDYNWNLNISKEERR